MSGSQHFVQTLFNEVSMKVLNIIDGYESVNLA